MNEVTNKTKILILLLNNFDDSSKPLTGAQIRKIINYSYEESIDLEQLTLKNEKLINNIALSCDLNATQISHQLSYGLKLGIKINEWQKHGIWVLSVFDYDSFPLKLLEKARQKISPLLFGAGNLNLLSNPSIGIVGSRDINHSTENYIKKAVSKINEYGFSIVSGAAKGVDIMAMNESLENGNCSIGILGSDLIKNSRDRETINFINNDQLLLISPEFPDAHWTIGRAMGRNKYIYLLSSSVLVGQITQDSGGTWSGIKESSKNNWNKVYIKSSNLDPDLRDKLLAMNEVLLDIDFKLEEIEIKDDISIEMLRLEELASHLGKNISSTKSFLSKNNLSCLDYSKPEKKISAKPEKDKQSELF